MSETERLIINYQSSLSVQLLESKTELSFEVLTTIPQISNQGFENHNEFLAIDQLPPHFTQRNILIVDSVHSGNRSTGKHAFDNLLKPLFKAIGLSDKYAYYKTTSKSYIEKELPDLIDLNQPNLLIFLSGDTSLNEFVNSIYLNNNAGNSDIILFNIPLGTGNAFANSLNHSSILKSIKCLLSPSSKLEKLPIYKATFPKGSKLAHDPYSSISELLFLVVGSWCLHSCLVADSDSPELRQEYGADRFRVAAERLLVKNPVFKGMIRKRSKAEDSDWTIIKDKGSELGYFVVSAVSKFEKTFLISPDSKINKAELHIIAFDHLSSSDDVMQIMGEVYNNGSHVKDERVSYLRVGQEEIIELAIDSEIKDDALLRICIDGSTVFVGDDGDSQKDRILQFESFNVDGLFYLS